ncbi:hypothetical protein [Saccharothrix texasensis]|uniref:hypothetical protein n=1 Tax=Saccharothrix texasensis TaxID=103734 RepID=UPI0011CE1E80|nr:hypothetical protein [Saccharothrix texasensis]
MAVVVAVVAIVVGAWATFRSARPRRVLYVWVDSAVPLINSTPGLDGRKLTVSLDDQELTAPYAVTVEVISRGAVDIAASAFGGTPLELEFDAPILTLLDKTVNAGRPAVREPRTEVVGTALHIGPALLTRRHRLRYTLLLDGKPEFRPVGELENVVIRDISPPPPAPKARYISFASAFLAISVLAVVLNGGLSSRIVLGMIATGAVFGLFLMLSSTNDKLLKSSSNTKQTN